MNVQQRITQIDTVIANGPFQADWASLRAYRIPRWFEDAKFGIFIHWGVCAVPGFGRGWYPRNMYLPGSAEFEHHRQTYGEQTVFGYKDFIPHFTAEQFDPDEWAELFRKSGARYVVPVAEHHDGFCLYDSELSTWTAAQMGPKRDLIGELCEAVRKRGLAFGVSSHRAEHWWFFNGGMQFPSDVQDRRYVDLYGPAQLESAPPDEQFLGDWLARTVELVDKYRPQIVYFDWWIEQPVFAPYLQKFAAYYYNRAASWHQGVAINYKHNAFPVGTAVYDVEREHPENIQHRFWQLDTGISKDTWFYVGKQFPSPQYKTAHDVISDLVDIVSKNGGLLLSIGPKEDGTIPLVEQEILLEVGRWLGRYGEAVYGTRPWTIYGEGRMTSWEPSADPFVDPKRDAFTSQDIRFTTRDGTLYAIVMEWPADGQVRVRSLGRHATTATDQRLTVELLGYPDELVIAQLDNVLVIQLPRRSRKGGPLALRIRTGSPSQAVP